MSDIPLTAANSYAPPVNRLLSLGEPRRNESRDYAALGISADAFPELIRMATDEALNDGPQDSKLVWSPVHAWRALGQLRAPEPGRNDPCPCGSGKKYKKCCGA